MDEYLLTHLLTSGENLFQIYRRLFGITIYRTRSAIYYTCLTYRNISDALARLTSDHKYFSIYPNINTSQYVTLVSEDHDGPNDHNECDDPYYHEDEDEDEDDALLCQK